jgi:hypothetical protein
VPLICRHNRFIAECPICSKGTVLDPARRPEPRSRSGERGSRRGRPAAVAAAPEVKGPYGVAGPYDSDDGAYEVRLEKVPGGLRLAAWAAGSIQRRAPVLTAGDLPRLLSSAAERGALVEDQAQAMLASLADPAQGGGDGFGSSPGRTGELRDELRVECLDGERLRIARWIARPGRGWELQEAPVMLPAARYAEALASAAERDALCR